ncbi:exodeoxyribonuclease V subunit alpha [bacterium]|nr:exodeoxyribonuclease V subunit alpha [bacterium]
MPVSFEQLKTHGLLAPIHLALAESFRRLDPNVSEGVVLAAALAGEQLSRGHVCLDLDSLDSVSFQPADLDVPARTISDWPHRADWAHCLQNSSLVTTIEASASDDCRSPDTPLVFDTQHHRVYLARYWHYEQTLAALIRRRVNSPLQPPDEAKLQQDIATLFPDRDTPGGRGQCLAAANAIDRSFAVITGGPGTGKTTTVARLLALRLLQARVTDGESGSGSQINSGLRVLLMAPTGKAAQRLNESLQRAAARLQIDKDVRAALNEIAAGTIHRVLGWTPTPPERGGPFRHNADHPLDADIVLVDEASMVDVGLMCRLFEAVPADAQIILMGDHDQLASVEAGGILGDLCGDLAGEALNVDVDRGQVLAARTGLDLTRNDGTAVSKTTGPTPLQRSIVALTFSHRFSSESQLGQLAAAIRAGDASTAIALLADSNSEQIEWLPGRNFTATLDEVVRRAALGYSSYLELLRQQPAGSANVLGELNRQRVLCAHRDGQAGESTLNHRITDRLAAIGLIRPVRQHYSGRPVMVTRNDYRLNLFNGDVGVVVRESGRATGSGRAGSSDSAVLFEDSTSEDGVRRVPESLVPDAQDCFAMTIHKSQGSEFHHVLLVLPPMDSPVLSRELLYTAVTRVKDEFDAATGKTQPGQLCLAASETVLRAAIDRQIRRTSGVRDAIEKQ